MIIVIINMIFAHRKKEENSCFGEEEVGKGEEGKYNLFRDSINIQMTEGRRKYSSFHSQSVSSFFILWENDSLSLTYFSLISGSRPTPTLRPERLSQELQHYSSLFFYLVSPKVERWSNFLSESDTWIESRLVLFSASTIPPSIFPFSRSHHQRQELSGIQVLEKGRETEQSQNLKRIPFHLAPLTS